MKRLILSAFLVAIGLSGFSQKHVKLSFAGSPSVNWMTSNNPDAEREKLVPGYDFGLSGDLYFSEDERYSFSTGIQISNIGGEISYHTNTSFPFSGVSLPPLSKIRYRLRYVEIPMSIKLKTDQFRRVRYWGQFGLSAMLNIESKGDSNDGSLKKANINSEINLFNLAMNVGAGFDFELNGNNSFTTGLIFQNGLIDVTTNNAFTDKTIINSLKLKIGLIF
ncbi:MAG: outer membrane beta-barrel protein [Bacteroidota bacterium]|nr:outer membrane beta-barrel protein [Bacteroidota bacterium]